MRLSFSSVKEARLQLTENNTLFNECASRPLNTRTQFAVEGICEDCNHLSLIAHLYYIINGHPFLPMSS